jgi:predicted porin
VKDGFNAFSLPGDEKNLVTVLYNDITGAYRVNNKLSFVGNFAIEKTTGSPRTAIEHKNPSNTLVSLNDFIDQIGHMYAVGVDYDISSKTSVHLRTKYMDHKDNNFTLDKFSGFETTFELKIFL